MRFFLMENHFEGHLMVSSRKVDSKVLRWQFKVFMRKRGNGKCKIRNFRRFFLGTSSVAAFKVHVLAKDLIFFIFYKFFLLE